MISYLKSSGSRRSEKIKWVIYKGPDEGDEQFIYKTLEHYIVGVLYLFSIIILTSIIRFGVYSTSSYTLTKEIAILTPVSLAMIMIIEFILLVNIN